jgi:transposase
MHITTIGLDLAKNIFQVHGVTEDGEIAFNRSLRRKQVLSFFKRLEPCVVGMEACGTSHYWAREITRLGHDVRLVPPAYVKPYVKRGKSDAVDAEAICEAVARPTMRFVEIKSADQQAALFLHRGRDLMGDRYLRRLLITGMTARVRQAKRYPDRSDPWTIAILARKPARLATVAMANKTARIIWAVLTRNERFEMRAA